MLLLRVPQIIVEQRSSKHSPGDISGHILIHQAIRKLGIRGADYNPRFLFDGSGYPAGFHWIFSKVFPNGAVFRRFGFFIPLASDVSLVLLATMFGRHLEVEFWYWLLLFAVAPLLWSNVGRASHINERAFGSLFGNVFLISMVFFLESPSVPATLGLLLGMGIVSTSSKFTLQGISFISIVYSLVSLSALPVMLLATSWIVANLLLKGYPWVVLKGAVAHSRNYFRHLMKKMPETARNFPLELFTGWRNPRKLATNWIVRTFLESPLHLVVVFYCFSLIPEGSPWTVLTLASFVVALTISIPKLTFLGESYRYLELGLLSSFLLLASRVDNIGLFVATFLFYLFLSARFLIWPTIRFARAGQANDEFYAELGRQIELFNSGNVLSVPGRIGIFLARCNPKLRHLWMLSHIGPGEAEDKYFKILGETYPYPIMNILEIDRLARLDFVVIDVLAAPEWASYAANVSNLRELWSNSRFIIYQHTSTPDDPSPLF